MVTLVILALALIGCSRQALGPYSGGSAPTARNIPLAETTYQDARQYCREDPERAERLLRQALDADLYHGTAHNDLGVILLQRGELYAAAKEFEWARTLMPGHPDPRVNLAVALERGGHYADAYQAARSALDVRPGHLPAIQALALLTMREGLQPAGGKPELRAWLATLRQRAPAPWNDWAQLQESRVDHWAQQ